MTSPLPLSAPTALDYFAALVADDADLPLLEAAIAVGQDEDPTLDVQQCLAEIDRLAMRLVHRIPADAGALQRLQLLNQYFFGDLAFAGNVNDYYDPRNSLLSEVLRTRRGIPITLALLYAELATQAGLKAAGVSFPGHFLVKLSMPRGELVLDPFTGESLSREALDERLQPFLQRRGLQGDFEAPLGLFLQSAAPRDVLARLLRNLKEIHQTARDWHRLLAVQQRLVVLLPSDWQERRDRGVVLARLGLVEPAARDLEAYVAACPGAGDVPALRTQLDGLRGRRSGWLH